MSIERIFAELDSRAFKFVANGKTFELPHLNTLKRSIVEAYSIKEYRNAKGEILSYALMMHLYRSSGNALFIEELRKMPLREAQEIFRAWWKWSGVDMGKYLGALGVVEEFPNALEMDLLELGKDLASFFDMSIRQQVSIVMALTNETSSYLYAGINELAYRWGIEKELLAESVENFATANSKKDAKPYRVARPFPEPGVHVITEEEQAFINTVLPDIF